MSWCYKIFLTVILASCQFTGSSDTGSELQSGSQQPYVEQWQTDQIDAIKIGVLTPEQVFRKLGSRPAGAERQIEFLMHLFSDFYTHNTSIGMGDVLELTFGLAITENPRFITDGDLDKSVFRQWAEDAYRRLDRNPARLNYFPTLRLEHISEAYQLAFAESEANFHLTSTRPYPRKSFDNRIFQLRTSGCVQHDTDMMTHDLYPELGIYRGSSLLDEEVSDCFHHNSEVLAEVLNRLANTIVGESIQTQIRTDTGAVATIRSYRELLRYLSSTIEHFEFFNTRTIMDPLRAMYSEDQDTYYAIKMPVWIRVRINDREIRLPAEQAELNLSLFYQGKRFAQLKYSDNQESSESAVRGSYWRAQSKKMFAWRGPLHEFINTYSAPNLSDLELWLTSVAHGMRGLQSIFDKFRPAFYSYNSLNCTDTATLAVAKYDSNFHSYRRTTHTFPNLRATTIDTSSRSQTLDLEMLVSEFSSIPPRFLTENYPTDITLEMNDAKGFADRLKHAFLPANIERYRLFPEVKTSIRDSIHTK